jgi:hypothetical protein
MNTKTFVRALVAAAIVCGCSTMSGSPEIRAYQCKRGGCEATITIDTSSGTPKAVINNKEMKLKKGDRDPLIVWILDADDKYRFDTGSIAPHTGSPTGDKMTTSQSSWDGQFTFLASNKNRWIVKAANTASNTYYYDVKIYDDSGNTYPIDPAIMNDP